MDNNLFSGCSDRNRRITGDRVLHNQGLEGGMRCTTYLQGTQPSLLFGKLARCERSHVGPISVMSLDEMVPKDSHERVLDSR